MLLDAVNDFLRTFLADISQENLFRGYSNRMALPADNEYIIYSVVNTQRVGTNIISYKLSEKSKITLKTLRQYAVDVDICSNDRGTAQNRATTIETIGRSYIAVDFFKQREIDFDYCDDVQYLPFTDDTEQYVERYRVTLHFTRWEEVEVSQDYAERVIAKVINIDTYPVKEVK